MSKPRFLAINDYGLDYTPWFGTDPEVVILNRHKQAVPAHTLGFPPPENKLNLGRGKAFRDGYMVEINVPPSECRQTMAYAVQACLKQIQKRLPPGYTLSTLPAVEVDLRGVKTWPSDVRVFGCSPSFDAYTESAKVCPIDAMKHKWRYAGGHLHFSTPKSARGYATAPACLRWMHNPSNYPLAIKLFDRELGVGLSTIFHRPVQYQRRKAYGQAGEFRPQVYEGGASVGLEYRVPGPEVWNHPAISSYAYGIGRWVCTNFKALAKTWDRTIEDDLQDAINTGSGRLRMQNLALNPYAKEVTAGLAKRRLFSLQLPKLNSLAIQNGVTEWGMKWGIFTDDVYEYDF